MYINFPPQGTFKYQHDTGKDLKYIHVFPFVTIQEVTDNTLRIGGPLFRFLNAAKRPST